jgi:hypothetical protein
VYQAWVEEQIEDFKAALSRDELLDIAEQAVDRIHDTPDGQIPLTELLVCDAVDALLFERLNLPDYREWERACQKDTRHRSLKGTASPARAAS